MFRLNNIFTFIFIGAVAASFFQLGSLGNGISSTLANAQEVSPTIAVTPTPKQVKHLESFKPERIVINDVDIDLLVFSVPLKEGTWEVLPHVANYAEETSLINKNNGNVGIYAHDRLDGFAKIKQLSAGSTIIVYGNNQKATYEIVSSKKVAATDVSVFQQTEKPMLTLVTCDGVFSEKRYMIKSKLVSLERDK